MLKSGIRVTHRHCKGYTGTVKGSAVAVIHHRKVTLYQVKWDERKSQIGIPLQYGGETNRTCHIYGYPESSLQPVTKKSDPNFYLYSLEGVRSKFRRGFVDAYLFMPNSGLVRRVTPDNYKKIAKQFREMSSW